MRKKNPLIKDLVAGPGLIDNLNDSTQQEKINGLSEDAQKELAEDLAIIWIEQGKEARELLNIKRHIPASKHDKELTGFNLYLLQAVNLYAAFYGLCDERNKHPESMLNELTPEIFDQLNDMPELRDCVFDNILSPTVDNILLKTDEQKRADFSKAFRSQPDISQLFNSANEVMGWLVTLKGTTPWKMFEQRGITPDTFLSHSQLVESMISASDAEEIGQRLQDTPPGINETVTKGLHFLDEAFKGLDRVNESNNIFTIMCRSMATIKPSTEPKNASPTFLEEAFQEIRNMAHKMLSKESIFKPAEPEKTESGVDLHFRP